MDDSHTIHGPRREGKSRFYCEWAVNSQAFKNSVGHKSGAVAHDRSSLPTLLRLQFVSPRNAAMQVTEPCCGCSVAPSPNRPRGSTGRPTVGWTVYLHG